MVRKTVLFFFAGFKSSLTNHDGYLFLPTY
jgi:hypothetical protein